MAVVHTRHGETYHSSLEQLMRSIESDINDMYDSIESSDDLTLRHFPYCHGVANEDYAGLMARMAYALSELERLRCLVVAKSKQCGIEVPRRVAVVGEPIARTVETFRNMARWAEDR